MTISLSWQSFKGSQAPRHQLEELDAKSTVGRAPDNNFVLHDPDKYVSRYHATIYEVSGNWFIKDTSSTATVINNSVTLQRGQQFLLSIGDEISIGESVLRVEDISETAQIIEDSWNDRSGRIEPTMGSIPEPQSAPATLARPPESPSAPATLVRSPEPPQAPTTLARSPEAPPTSETYQPQAEVSTESLSFNIDDFFDDAPESSDEQMIEPPNPAKTTTQPQSLQASPNAISPNASASHVVDTSSELSQDTLALRAFLKELDMDASQLIGQNKMDVMRVAGVLLKTLTEGMMGVLNARSLMKEKLELDQTQIRQEKNNAFKFSKTPEDALAKMLTQESGYMDPVSAANEAVDDARAHQLAMISGLNIAIQQTIESFDPKSLEEEFEVGFSFSKKAKYWDIYCQIYETVAENAQSDSSNIFMKHFREHYQLQISKLNK